jgi:hypothetical protein
MDEPEMDDGVSVVAPDPGAASADRGEV